MPDEPLSSELPQEVTTRLKALGSELDVAIPAKRLDRNLLIATWNLRVFGGLTKKWETGPADSPKRNLADLHYVGEIVSRFDVVAVQEVKGNLSACRHLLTDVLGPNWGWILTDVPQTDEANEERLAFLFDRRRVTPSGLAGEFSEPFVVAGQTTVLGPLQRQFARTPYAVSFLSAKTTFLLVTLHVLYGKNTEGRKHELTAIAQKLASFAREINTWGHNMICLGDFNIDREGDDLFDAFTSTGLTPAPQLNAEPRTIFDQPDDKQKHFYDQIAWFTDEHKSPALSLECLSAGSYDFVPLLQDDRTKEKLSFHISDHYPLWVEFALPREP